MGIKNLNKLLKRESEEGFFTISIKDLKDKRIAIDGNLWMHRNMATTKNKILSKIDLHSYTIEEIENLSYKELNKSLIKFILEWLNNGITPLFVFDGVHPDEKQETKDKRKKIYETKRDKIKNLMGEIRTEEMNKELFKLIRGDIHIDQYNKKLLEGTIKYMGVPLIKAKGEAEKLCSMLCIDNKVAAVYSDDTDNLVYGCPLLITRFSKNIFYEKQSSPLEPLTRVKHLECVRFDKILENLKLTHENFVDLCIMCGCDYNKNMPGYGSIKCFNLIKKFNNINNLPTDKFDTSCLNYSKCRELFSYEPSEFLIDSNFDFNIDTNYVLPQDKNLEKYDILQNHLKYLDIFNIFYEIVNTYKHYNLINAKSLNGLIFDDILISKYISDTNFDDFNNIEKNRTPKPIKLNICQN